MKEIIDIRIRRFITVAVLALLLGAQSAQAGHFHADNLLADDCLQCLVDCGQALTSFTSQGLLANKPSLELPQAPSPAALFSHYRRAARGPPARSC